VTQIYVNRSASLKRFSGIVFTINELVDRISNFKFNASQNDQTEDFYANPPPQARYFTMKTCTASQIFNQTECAAGRNR